MRARSELFYAQAVHCGDGYTDYRRSVQDCLAQPTNMNASLKAFVMQGIVTHRRQEPGGVYDRVTGSIAPSLALFRLVQPVGRETGSGAGWAE